MGLGLRILIAMGLSTGLLYLWRQWVSPRVSRVVVIGDSLASGGFAFPYLLDKKFEAPILTFAFPGKGTKDIFEGVHWPSVAKGASHTIVLAGVNDLASRRPMKHIQNNLAKIYRQARLQGSVVVGVGLTPWARHIKGAKLQDETEALNNWIRANANIYIDTEPLGDGLGRLLPEYDSGDGLHLNRKGQRALAGLIEERIRV